MQSGQVHGDGFGQMLHQLHDVYLCTHHDLQAADLDIAPNNFKVNEECPDPADIFLDKLGDTGL